MSFLKTLFRKTKFCTNQFTLFPDVVQNLMKSYKQNSVFQELVCYSSDCCFYIILVIRPTLDDVFVDVHCSDFNITKMYNACSDKKFVINEFFDKVTEMRTVGHADFSNFTELLGLIKNVVKPQIKSRKKYFIKYTHGRYWHDGEPDKELKFNENFNTEKLWFFLHFNRGDYQIYTPDYFVPKVIKACRNLRKKSLLLVTKSRYKITNSSIYEKQVFRIIFSLSQ